MDEAASAPTRSGASPPGGRAAGGGERDDPLTAADDAAAVTAATAAAAAAVPSAAGGSLTRARFSQRGRRAGGPAGATHPRVRPPLKHQWHGRRAALPAGRRRGRLAACSCHPPSPPIPPSKPLSGSLIFAAGPPGPRWRAPVGRALRPLLPPPTPSPARPSRPPPRRQQPRRRPVPPPPRTRPRPPPTQCQTQRKMPRVDRRPPPPPRRAAPPPESVATPRRRCRRRRHRPWLPPPPARPLGGRGWPPPPAARHARRRPAVQPGQPPKRGTTAGAAWPPPWRRPPARHRGENTDQIDDPCRHQRQQRRPRPQTPVIQTYVALEVLVRGRTESKVPLAADVCHHLAVHRRRHRDGVEALMDATHIRSRRVRREVKVCTPRAQAVTLEPNVARTIGCSLTTCSAIWVPSRP